MSKVQLIDGSIVDAQLTDIQYIGDEGARRAIAHIDGKTYRVYNSIVDGFNEVWHEQISVEEAVQKSLKDHKRAIEYLKDK